MIGDNCDELVLPDWMTSLPGADRDAVIARYSRTRAAYEMTPKPWIIYAFATPTRGLVKVGISHRLSDRRKREIARRWPQLGDLQTMAEGTVGDLNEMAAVFVEVATHSALVAEHGWRLLPFQDWLSPPNGTTDADLIKHFEHALAAALATDRSPMTHPPDRLLDPLEVWRGSGDTS